MKKTLIMLMVLTMLVFGLCACKKNEGEQISSVETEIEINDNEFGRDNEAYYNNEWAK